MIDNKIPQINLGATIVKYFHIPRLKTWEKEQINLGATIVKNFHFPRLKTWEKEQINLGTTIVENLLSNQTSGSS